MWVYQELVAQRVKKGRQEQQVKFQVSKYDGLLKKNNIIEVHIPLVSSSINNFHT